MLRIAICLGFEIVSFLEFILDMGSAIVRSSLVGWAYTQKDPCFIASLQGY